MTFEAQQVHLSNVQGEFFRCHALLHPERDELEELLNHGASVGTVLRLYPLDLEALPTHLRALLHGDRAGVEVFCKQIMETTDMVRANSKTRLRGDCYVRFHLEGYNALMASPDGQWWINRGSTDTPQVQSAVWALRSVSELLWVGAHWNELPELWDLQSDYADALRAVRAAVNSCGGNQPSSQIPTTA